MTDAVSNKQQCAIWGPIYDETVKPEGSASYTEVIAWARSIMRICNTEG